VCICVFLCLFVCARMCVGMCVRVCLCACIVRVNEQVRVPIPMSQGVIVGSPHFSLFLSILFSLPMSVSFVPYSEEDIKLAALLILLYLFISLFFNSSLSSFFSLSSSVSFPFLYIFSFFLFSSTWKAITLRYRMKFSQCSRMIHGEGYFIFYHWSDAISKPNIRNTFHHFYGMGWKKRNLHRRMSKLPGLQGSLVLPAAKMIRKIRIIMLAK